MDLSSPSTSVIPRLTWSLRKQSMLLHTSDTLVQMSENQQFNISSVYSKLPYNFLNTATLLLYMQGLTCKGFNMWIQVDTKLNSHVGCNFFYR